MRPIILEVSSDRSVLLIEAELKSLRMSRADLQRRFAEGVKLMEGTTAIGYDPAPMRPRTANGSSLWCNIRRSAIRSSRIGRSARRTRKERRPGD